MDLSPRQTTTLERPAPVPRRNWRAYVLLAVVLIAGGVVVTKFLTSAIDYYCNVDEVVAHKSGCEAGRRLRIQGTVEEGTIKKTGAVTDFMIAFNGKQLSVHYDGDPGGLFQECIPVVVHGTYVAPVGTANGVFDGDQLEVKHSNEYAAKNPDRLNKAKSAACSQPQA